MSEKNKQILKELEFRFFRNGDESKILSLVKKCFSVRTEMSKDYWLWRYKKNPAGKGIICLAFHNSKLVSHYAISLVKCYFLGEEVIAGLSMTTMTHPKYRGLGFFPKLAKKVYQKAKNEGIYLIYGYPNNYSVNTLQEKLNWEMMKPINIWVYNKHQKLQKLRRYDLIQIKSLSNIKWKFSQKYLKKKYKFIVKRDKTYFNWRYLDATDTNFYLFKLDLKNETKGIIVFKIFKKLDFEQKGHIIDYLVVDKKYTKPLFIKSIEFFNNKNIEDITLWTLPRTGFELGLNEIGFINEKISLENFGYIMNFGFLILKPEKLGKKKVNIEDFYLMTGDCNIF